MPMLAFFPWLKIESEIDFNCIKLIPFTRRVNRSEDRSEELQAQNTIERVLAPYILPNGKPVNQATIIQLKNKNIFSDLSEDERNFLFSFSEIIAFSGLSERLYFDRFAYFNRDNFVFMIQSFTDDSTSVSVRSRRRDGYTDQIISGAIYKIQIPFHVAATHDQLVRFNIPLIASLINAQETFGPDDWLSYYDAMFHFNRANTDDSQLSEHQEIVMLVSAFERLLNCNRGKEDDLVMEFLAFFSPEKVFALDASKRIAGSSYVKDCKSLREAWIRDLFRLRGDFAHGKRTSKIPLSWSASEHLLLGSHAFSLVLKCKLSNKNLYQLSEEDMFNINVFEELADAELLKQCEDGAFSWNSIRGKSEFNPSNIKLKKAFLDAFEKNKL